MSPSIYLLTVVAAVMVVVTGVRGYGKGAPVEQCDQMKPGHYGADYRPATQDSPFAINASRYVYGANEPSNITVTILTQANDTHPPFRGFMLQARNGSGTPTGTFSVHPDSSLQLIPCGGHNDTAVTHTLTFSQAGAREAQAVWTPPGVPAGNVTFVATVVQHVTLVYMDVRSHPVVFSDSGGVQLPSLSGFCLFVCCLMPAVLCSQGPRF
ncbi:hypothetical protein ACOMHN_021524 [Nucella lapillus]